MTNCFKKTKLHLSYLIVFTLTIIGFLLRAFNVNIHPPPDVDEYSIAYNAYAIAKQGIDEWGISFPLFFKAYGDYKLPFDIYFAALLFKIFEPTTFWLRFPAILLGTLYIPLIFIFLKQLTKNKIIIYLGVFLMAFSPYGIFFSRTISGSISQSFFTFLSILLFTLYLKKHRAYLISLSIISLAVSLYTYPSAWIVSPLLYLFYFFIILWQKKYKLLPFFFIFIIVFIPVVKQYFSGGSRVRYENVSLNFYKGMVLEINEFRHHTKNDILSRFLHNKPIYYTYTFIKNYLNHFDTNILAYGRNIIVQDNSPFPILFFVTIPFFYLGLVILLKKYKDPIYLLILVWIAVSPLPSVITDGGMNSKRFLTFLGSEIILIALGLEMIGFTSKKYLFIFCTLLFINVGYFVYSYFLPYQQLTKTHLFFKANKLAKTVKENYQNFDAIVYTPEFLGEPQIYPLFATLLPPKKYTQIKKYKCNSWCYIKPFDKFYYDQDLDNIIQFTNINIKQKKIWGFFSETEIIKLKQLVCFRLINKYIPPGNYQLESYYEVEFKPCL